MSAFISHTYFRHCFLILILNLFWVIPANAGSSKLDALFIELKNADNVTEARVLEQKIWKQWFKSGDTTVDEMMQDAMEKRRAYDYDGAIVILNRVVTMKPDYSEGWNQRATIYFYQQKYEESLIDIAKTLELEPRHFGSLAGRAVIRLQQNKPALARQNIIEALKFHPYLKEKDYFPDLRQA